jgi:translocation and assembly module TamB
VVARALDLGTLANVTPTMAWSGQKGSLSATLDIRSLPLSAPQRADLALVIESLELSRGGLSAHLLGPTGSVALSGDELSVPDFKVRLRSGSGLTATVVAGGAVHHAVSAADLDVGVRVEPVDLARLSADIPSVERAGGTLSAGVRGRGPLGSLSWSGAAEVQKGELQLKIKGVPVNVSDANARFELAGGDVRVTRAEARVNGGTVKATGRMPLSGPDSLSVAANIAVRGLKLPVADGINLTADSDLDGSYRFGAHGDDKLRVPEVKGTVEITQFSYTRPINLNPNLNELGRARPTHVETYDPANDSLRFDLNVVSPRPLHFTNNLVDGDVEVMSPGLVISGTDQRYGAHGLLRVLPDSKLQLRSNEFLVREGFVHFDDPLKIAPKLDVRAQTEYRRYAASSAAAPPAGTSQESGVPGGTSASPVSAAASTSTAGLWRIQLQLQGEIENLKVTMSSDPSLSQEDIFLLLAIGMTRAEMDRGGTSALGETVGLEALSALTGADKAVKTIVPIIDDFHFGTGYSTRTARTEPTVTVGKRLTNDVRASVTTGVSEDREVRANVEWRLNNHVSVQGSYDNLNDVSSSPVGNVGVDLRWRLDFE